MNVDLRENYALFQTKMFEKHTLSSGTPLCRLLHVEGAADLMAASQRMQFRVEDLNLSTVTTSGN